MALATAAATTATACAPASTFPLARSGIHPARPTLAAMSFVDSAPVLAAAAAAAAATGGPPRCAALCSASSNGTRASSIVRSPCPASPARSIPLMPARTSAAAISRGWGIHLTGLALVSGSPWPGCSRAVDARRVASSAGRCGWRCLGLRVGDQVAVAHWVVGDGELEHAVEDQSPAAGPAPVEAEREFVEVALQVLLVDRALVGAQQPALGQGGHAVHSGQQLAGVVPAGASRPLAAPVVGVAEPVDAAVALPGVGDHRRARLDVPGDEGVQRRGGSIGQDLHPAAPVPSWLPDLDGHAD